MARLKPTANAYARISYARELLGDTGRGDRGDGAGGRCFGRRRGAVGLVANAARQPAAEHAAAGEAEVRFREALAFVPGYPGALSGLAELRTAAGDLEGAAALYRRAAAAAPVPEFAASLGDTLAALGRTGRGGAGVARGGELERLFAANGGRNLLETAEFDLESRPQRPLARSTVRGAAASERPSVEGDHVLAWALYKNGHCAEARTVSLRSLRLGTLDVDGLYHHSLIERVPRERRGRGGLPGPRRGSSTRPICDARRLRGGCRPKR